MKSRDGRFFGWIPDRPDQRDWKYAAPAPTPETKLKVIADLSPKLPQVYDQGSIGSCTANAVCGSSQFLKPLFSPSRLFLYYNTRLMEGTEYFDAGATIRDTIKSMAADGLAPEVDWPYDVKQFAQKPPQQAYDDAIHHRALAYRRIDRSLTNLQSVISNDGLPFVFGFAVYISFMAIGADGMMPVPKMNEEVVGGHAVLAVGYNHHTKLFKVRNSWGTGWGKAGYFFMPYEVMLNPNISDDYWVVSAEE